MRDRLVTATGTVIHLRPAAAADEPFLHALYADRRAPELAAFGWSDGQRRAFVDMQFRAQQTGYGSAFPEADHWVVTVNGTNTGRLLLDRRADEHRVVDVVILSENRGRGIGTALMSEVVDGARAVGLPVHLSVDAFDTRLVRWYERQGFAVVGRREPLLLMAFPAGERARN